MTTPADHRGFPWRTTAVVAAIVIVATIATGLLLGRDRVDGGGEAPIPTASASAVATPPPLVEERQLTVLLTVRDGDHVAVSNMLVGFGGGTRAVAELMLPRDLLLPTVPPRRLAAIDDPSRPVSAEQPLETLLGVQIDTVVDLERLAWTGLIDATGTRVDPDASEQPGAFALAVDRVLKGLPYDDESAGQLLTGLGSMARTTVTSEDAGYLLAQLGRNLRKLPVDRRTLPVTYLRAGRDRVAVADVATTDAVVREMFPQALLATGHAGAPRIVLQPAGATVGSAVAARLTLAGEGFGVVVDVAAAEPVTNSEVIIPNGSPAARSIGAEVATALGLPLSAVGVAAVDDAVVDARVLLGPDAAAGSTQP